MCAERLGTEADGSSVCAERLDTEAECDDLVVMCDKKCLTCLIACYCWFGQVTSYGGKLTYTILVRVPQDIPVVGVVTVDVRLEVCLSVCLSVCLPVCLSVCLSVTGTTAHQKTL